MATLQFRAHLSEAQLADARASLAHLLELESEHEFDLEPTLLDLLHRLEEAIADALQPDDADVDPLGNLPLTIATRLAGGRESPPAED